MLKLAEMKLVIVVPTVKIAPLWHSDTSSSIPTYYMKLHSAPSPLSRTRDTTEETRDRIQRMLRLERIMPSFTEKKPISEIYAKYFKHEIRSMFFAVDLLLNVTLFS